MPASVLVCTPVPLEFHAGLPAPAPGWRRRRAHRYWRVAPLAPARPAVDRYKAATSTGATHLLITQVTRRPQSGWRANRKGRRAAVARHSRGRRRRTRDRTSVVKGKSVSVRVDLGGRRIIKQKNKTIQYYVSLSNITKDQQ